MIRSEIRARILHGLNESDVSTPVFWDEDELNAIIDEAAEVICEEADAIKRTAFVPLQAMQQYYSLRAIAPDVMSPYRIWHQDQETRLQAVSMITLDSRHETWQTVSGDPVAWFPVSWETFGLWPCPAAGTGVIRVDYLAWPRPLLDDEDESELPEPDHDALVVYGIYDGLAKRWDAKRAMEAWQIFMRQWGDDRARSGVRRIQSQIQQRPIVPMPDMRTNLP